ncbi:phosphatase PAP2 family protein [Candidatus Woesearchaeota archaeon]|nr:phosphatase PAP2 family protein [Candidatus Woesearchaeota archaeon]
MKKTILIIGLLLILSFVFDNWIIDFVTSLRTENVTSFMMVITSIGFLFVVFVSYSFLLKNNKKIALLILSIVLSYLIGFILKLLIMRERPDAALFFESSYSFPSNHAATIFSTLPLMTKNFPKYIYLFFIVAILVSFSRIYLGVHYASDLILGGFLGYTIGLIVMKFGEKKWKINGRN